MKLEAIELTEEQIAALRNLRGCSCHINPPCSSCVDPITEDEAAQLGIEFDEEDRGRV
jgi:hypothetical protein